MAAVFKNYNCLFLLCRQNKVHSDVTSYKKFISCFVLFYVDEMELEESQGIASVIWLHPLGTIHFQDNPSYVIYHIQYFSVNCRGC